MNAGMSARLNSMTYGSALSSGASYAGSAMTTVSSQSLFSLSSARTNFEITLKKPEYAGGHSSIESINREKQRQQRSLPRYHFNKHGRCPQALVSRKSQIIRPILYRFPRASYITQPGIRNLTILFLFLQSQMATHKP